MADVTGIAASIPAVALDVAVFIPQFRALSLCSAPVAFTKLLTKFAAILSNPGSIMTHVSIISAAVCVVASKIAVGSPVAIFRHQRAGA